MFVLFGESALTAFRVQRLLDQCQQSNLDVSGAHTSFLYLLDSEPTAAMKVRLQQLLGVVDTAFFAADFIVAPRLGTISPWSSKATDILRNCGVECDRIERAIGWQLEGEVNHRDKTLQALVHDRMTESVFDSCLLYTSPSPRDATLSRMPSSA